MMPGSNPWPVPSGLRRDGTGLGAGKEQMGHAVLARVLVMHPDLVERLRTIGTVLEGGEVSGQHLGPRFSQTFEEYGNLIARVPDLLVPAPHRQPALVMP